MSAVEAARRALVEAETALSKARADADQARQEFEAKPSDKSHARMVVSAQIATNAEAPIKAARDELERAEDEAAESVELAALEQASHARLLADTEPDLAELVELSARSEVICARIAAKLKAQHRAVDTATEVATKRNRYSSAPSKVAITFLRAICGVMITRRIFESKATFTIGLEPWTWLAARPEPPPGAPGVDEWRSARKHVSTEYLPSPIVDFLTSHAELHFFHEHPAGGRPYRHEVI